MVSVFVGKMPLLHVLINIGSDILKSQFFVGEVVIVKTGLTYRWVNDFRHNFSTRYCNCWDSTTFSKFRGSTVVLLKGSELCHTGKNYLGICIFKTSTQIQSFSSLKYQTRVWSDDWKGHCVPAILVFNSANQTAVQNFSKILIIA